MSLKILVNTKDIWDALLEELEERIQFTHKQLEQAQDEKELYRLQGDVRTLRRLKQLRDKVNG